MEEQACERFLNELSGMVRGRGRNVPLQLELPSVDSVGFGSNQEALRGEPDTRYSYAQFRDGLALLRSPIPRVIGYRAWMPLVGLEENYARHL